MIVTGFRRVLAAELASNFGSMLSRLVVPWIATLVLLATPWDMGLLRVADVAAGALAALLLGAVVDRASRRRVMIVCDLARAGLLALLAVLVFTGTASLAALIAITALTALLSMAFELARSAWMAEAIPEADLTLRNAQLSAATSATEAASFGLGGWIYQAVGGAWSLAVDAATYVASALCLMRVPEPPRAKPAAPAQTGMAALRALRAEARDGLVAIAADPTLRALAVLEVLLAGVTSLGATSYMIYVARDLALPTGVQGLVFATGALGALLGAACAPAVARRLGSGPALVVGLVLLAVGSACVPLASGAGWFAIALLVAHQVVGDCGAAMEAIHDRTLRQTHAPRALLARVDAGLRLLGQVTALVGAVAAGALATAIGAHGALLLAAVVAALTAAWAARALGRSDRAPTG